jgi:hypothetical protein
VLNGVHENAVDVLKTLAPPKRRGLFSELLTTEETKNQTMSRIADSKRAGRSGLGI